MGGRTSISCLGYQHHAQPVYKDDTVFMVYGAEVVLPSDIIHDLPRMVAYVPAENAQTRQDVVDLLEEHREQALERSAVYQQDLRRYHSRRVMTRTFQGGDLVIRWTQSKEGMHKLSPPWEGPFIVSRNLHNGSYYLVDAREKSEHTNDTTYSTKSLEERERPWNIAQLRPYYT